VTNREGLPSLIRLAGSPTVVETALEPELPIYDAHHHLWFPPRKQYLVEDFVKDIGNGHNIVKTVFVESMSVGKRQEKSPVYETKFIHEITQQPMQGQFGKIQIAAGIVGFVDFTTGAAVVPMLEEHLATSNRFRGIRHTVAWDDGPRSDPSLKGIMLNVKFREGFSYLERFNLVFDAMVFNTQLEELLDLARAFPNITIIINHMATPRSAEPKPEQVSKWKQDMAALADCPNMYVKLGGLGMIYGRNRSTQPPQASPSLVEVVKVMTPYFLYCIEKFGCSRCMFESNFPPDGDSFSYTTIWNIFKLVTKDFSKDERSALFHSTAAKVYRI
jgi:L-fuconolactonase